MLQIGCFNQICMYGERRRKQMIREVIRCMKWSFSLLHKLSLSLMTAALCWDVTSPFASHDRWVLKWLPAGVGGAGEICCELSRRSSWLACVIYGLGLPEKHKISHGVKGQAITAVYDDMFNSIWFLLKPKVKKKPKCACVVMLVFFCVCSCCSHVNLMERLVLWARHSPKCTYLHKWLYKFLCISVWIMNCIGHKRLLDA